MNTDKKYVGNGKQTHENYINISVELSSDHIRANKFTYNGREYVKLTVAKRKEADQYGKTHFVIIDEFKPEKQDGGSDNQEDQLPF